MVKDYDVVLNIHCAAQTNVGDKYSCPVLYFPFRERLVADIFELRDKNIHQMPESVIVGGGGLLGPYFMEPFEVLMRNRAAIKKLIGWGMGSNVHYRPEVGFQSEIDDLLPEFLKEFDLLGIRDFGTQYRWVPCASCMHDSLLQGYEVRNPVVIYEHKDLPIDIDGFPRLKNSEMEIRNVIAFLASSEAVITNTYHGVYWATLLGKRVVVLPFSSRFHGFKHPPVICSDGNWKVALEKSETYPNALAECCEANIAFYSEVISEFGFNL